MNGRWRVALAATAVLAGYATSTVAAASAPASGVPTCTENTSRQVVLSFIDAFNHGDAARLAQLIADYARYATDAPGAFSSPAPVNRSELIAYFVQRHQAHERLQLESLQFNSRSANDFNFVFEVTRSADGLAPTPFGGKGAVFCGNPSNGLILWAMGRESFLRARLPLYGSVALLLLAVGLAAALIGRRRVNRRKMKVAARAVRGEWIDG
jgi:hypothetical protein